MTSQITSLFDWYINSWQTYRFFYLFIVNGLFWLFFQHQRRSMQRIQCQMDTNLSEHDVAFEAQVSLAFICIFSKYRLNGLFFFSNLYIIKKKVFARVWVSSLLFGLPTAHRALKYFWVHLTRSLGKKNYTYIYIYIYINSKVRFFSFWTDISIL